MSPEKMQRALSCNVAASLQPGPWCRTPIATFFHTLGTLCQLCARGWGLMGEGDRHGHTTAGGQPRDKGWVWGRGARAGKWVLVGAGQRHWEGGESPPGRKWVGVRAIRMGGPETLESGQNSGTGSNHQLKPTVHCLPWMASPHIASQKTQQEHARVDSPVEPVPWFQPSETVWTYHLQSAKVIKCATLSLYNRGHMLQKLQGSQEHSWLPAEAGAGASWGGCG